MGKRLVQTIFLDQAGRDNPAKATYAKVYNDQDWGEFIVQFYVNGKHQTEGDYHAGGNKPGDKADAIATAYEQLNRYGRAKNPSKLPVPIERLKQIDADVHAHIVRTDSVTLYAMGSAYGRKQTIKDWENGKDFIAINPPKWEGGPYFSVRDADRIYDLGYRQIVVGGHDGFTIDLVVAPGSPEA